MGLTTPAPDSVAERIAEAEAVAALHRLNADYIGAFAKADTTWYRAHLSDGFVCTLVDGRRIDKTEFLRRSAEPSGMRDVRVDEIDVQPLGAVALVHGVMHYVRDGVRTSIRYTTVWRVRGGRWQAAAAHHTRVADTGPAMHDRDTRMHQTKPAVVPDGTDSRRKRHRGALRGIPVEAGGWHMHPSDSKPLLRSKPQGALPNLMEREGGEVLGVIRRGTLKAMRASTFIALLTTLVLAAPAFASGRHLTPADRKAIDHTLDVLVNNGVKRVNVGASYDVVTPTMRAGMTRKQWATGDIPIYPFPAQGRTFHHWNIKFITKDEVAVELVLFPTLRNKEGYGPIAFDAYLKPVKGRWLVDEFMPMATFAPVNAKKTKVRSVADYSPVNGSKPGSAPTHPGRINSIYAFVPFAVMGVVLLTLVGALLVGTRRYRPRSASLPPLPRASRARRASRPALPSGFRRF